MSEKKTSDAETRPSHTRRGYMADEPKFRRLEDDHAEETALKSLPLDNTRASPTYFKTRDIMSACGALAISLLPILLARTMGRLVPPPVASAMSKSAIASAAMLLCSLIGYGASVPIRLLAAFQHLAAGLLVSSVAVELIPPIMAAPNDLLTNFAIIGGFVGGTAAFFALGAYCSAPEDDDEEEAESGVTASSAAELAEVTEAVAALSTRDEFVILPNAPAAAPGASVSPRTPRTPRGLTKLAHVRRAAAVPAPPYPGALVAAVTVDSAVDGLLIGLASASATDVANAGVVLALALAIEMGFTGLAYAATLRKQPHVLGLLSVTAPPFVLLGASVLGAGAASSLVSYPSAHIAVLSFGATALLYLVVVELLREAHESMGDDAVTQLIEAMFFVGFFVAVLMERALSME